jgi:hypothetical protein
LRRERILGHLDDVIDDRGSDLSSEHESLDAQSRVEVKQPAEKRPLHFDQ